MHFFYYLSSAFFLHLLPCTCCMSGNLCTPPCFSRGPLGGSKAKHQPTGESPVGGFKSHIVPRRPQSWRRLIVEEVLRNREISVVCRATEISRLQNPEMAEINPQSFSGIRQIPSNYLTRKSPKICLFFSQASGFSRIYWYSSGFLWCSASFW